MAALRSQRSVTLLAVSDVVDEALYHPGVRERFGHVDLVVSCGDLPSDYLDYLTSMLDVPLLGVRGNHEHGLDGPAADHLAVPVGLLSEPLGAQGHRESGREAVPPNGRPPLAAGAVDLHGQVVMANGLLLAGLEGSHRYNRGACQYTEAEMWLQIARLAPALLANKARYGRYLDLLVTHAPPRGIHDQPDLCHRGFTAFRELLRIFRPRYHFHGHTHVYNRQIPVRTRYRETVVLNVYGHREVQVEQP